MTLKRAALLALWSPDVTGAELDELSLAFSLIMRNTGLDARDAEAILRRVAAKLRDPLRTQMLEEMKHAP